jgi:hypothetical protein
VATHRIPILGFATRPDDTGECFFEPADLNFGTNDLARQFVLALGSALAAAPTVKHGVYGAFRVPKNYVGTAKVIIEWSATLITNDVVFDFDYNAVAGNDAESLDPAAWQESVTVTDTAPGTARRKLTAEVALTSANLAVDDIVEFFFGRDGAAGGDTLAGRAYVVEVTFEYADA